jgi:carbonic anhydrase
LGDGFAFCESLLIGRRTRKRKDTPMSIIDQYLANNHKYAEQFTLGHLAMPPARKLAVLACMDARLTVEQFLGLNTGDAHIIRNAGGIASEDAVRSLIISHHLLGTEEFIIVNHTDCGMLTFRDHELLAKLEKENGGATVAPVHFHAFADVEENVRRQVQRVHNHPFIPRHIPVRGFVYDVKTGRLNEVTETVKAPTAAARKSA